MNHLSDQGRALAAALLHDAQLTELSEVTRVSAAFEAGFLYLICAAAPEIPTLHFCAPSKSVLSRCFESTQCSDQDRGLADQLMEWFERRYDLPPAPCATGAAVSWAIRMSKLAVAKKQNTNA